MNKCPNCSGTLESIGGGKYRCIYCFAEVSESDFVQKTSYTTHSSSEGVDVFEKNKNGVLEIFCRFAGGGSAGSGLLVTKSGYAITNAHVVTDHGKVSSEITVNIAGERVRATIVALGDDRGGFGNGVDLALLKLSSVPYKANVIQIGDFSKVRIGEQVFVVGNSLGDGTCITSGIVSDKTRKVGGKTLMMTDCAINGGNSGGPIFNAQGIAIGVIVSSRIHADGSATEGMNYAIPANIVKDFLAKSGVRV